MNDLITIKVEKARELLAAAKDAESAKRVVDLAHAAEIYARRQKLSDEAISYAHAIKADAITLLGEFLKEAEKNLGTQGQGRPRKIGAPKNGAPKNQPPKLSEIGISHNLSSDAQLMATVKAEAPEIHEEFREGKKTMAQVRKEVNEAIRPESEPEPEPEHRELRGKGLFLANEAINCLTRIPKNDALRKRGFQLVTDWIKRNP